MAYREDSEYAAHAMRSRSKDIQKRGIAAPAMKDLAPYAKEWIGEMAELVYGGMHAPRPGEGYLVGGWAWRSGKSMNI